MATHQILNDSKTKAHLSPIEFDTLCTEVGNARRLLRDYGCNLKYCRAMASLLVWNGKYWEKDTKEHTHTTALVHRVLQEMRNEGTELKLDAQTQLNALGDPNQDTPLKAEQREMLTRLYDHGEQLYKWSVSSESDRHIRGTIHQFCALPEVQVEESDLDRHLLLLNLQNGTLNLETFKFREHRREDLLTKIAACDYDPEAICPMFEKFLTETFPTKTVNGVTLKDAAGLIKYIQRLGGYSLTGLIVERVLPFLHGEGANGKTVLINILLMAVFGMEPDSYGMEANFKSFLQPSFVNEDKPRNDQMRMRGKRFITASENDDPNARLSLEELKKLSGDGWFSPRANFGQEKQFKPQAKLWLQLNNMPRVIDPSAAIWDRIKKIPFIACFNPARGGDKPDVELTKRIVEAEGAGILNWLITGLKEVQSAWKDKETALPEPEDVAGATLEFQQQQSQLGRFLDECYEPGEKTENVRTNAIYSRYTAWVVAQGEKYTAPKTQFFMELPRVVRTVWRNAVVEKRQDTDGKMAWFGMREKDTGPVV